MAGPDPADELKSSPMRLSECACCGRKFATHRLERHQSACFKAASKTRQAFVIQRWNEDELCAHGFMEKLKSHSATELPGVTQQLIVAYDP